MSFWRSSLCLLIALSINKLIIPIPYLTNDEIVSSCTFTLTFLPVWLTGFSSEYTVSYPLLSVKLLHVSDIGI